MAGVKGIMHTCCRCPEKIFLPVVDEGVTDGGYGVRYVKYEELPEEWLYESEFGYLCPNCAREFRQFMTEFFGLDKVIYKWRYDIPVKNENTCIGCGESIPEGKQVCPICEDIIDKFNKEKEQTNE